MKHKNIAFIGDSRLRELFYVLVDGVATNSFKNPLKAVSIYYICMQLIFFTTS